MNTSPSKLPPLNPEHLAPKQRSRWPRRLAIGAVVLVALFIGVGIGLAGSNQQSQLNAANAKVASANSKISSLRSQVGALQGQLSSLQGQLSSLQTQLGAAKNTTQHALAVATTKVQAADAARQAQLNQEAAQLKQQQAQLNQETGMVQANQISADGVYVIGHDMKGGVWHTTGGGQCYYALLSSTDTSNIIDNNNITGPATVDLSGAYAFQIGGGCTWVKIG